MGKRKVLGRQTLMFGIEETCSLWTGTPLPLAEQAVVERVVEDLARAVRQVRPYPLLEECPADTDDTMWEENDGDGSD